MKTLADFVCVSEAAPAIDTEPRYLSNWLYRHRLPEVLRAGERLLIPRDFLPTLRQLYHEPRKPGPKAKGVAS